MMVAKSRDSRLKRLNLFQVKLQYLLLLLRPVIHNNGILAGKALNVYGAILCCADWLFMINLNKDSGLGWTIFIDIAGCTGVCLCLSDITSVTSSFTASIKEFISSSSWSGPSLSDVISSLWRVVLLLTGGSGDHLPHTAHRWRWLLCREDMGG